MMYVLLTTPLFFSSLLNGMAKLHAVLLVCFFWGNLGNNFISLLKELPHFLCLHSTPFLSGIIPNAPKSNSVPFCTCMNILDALFQIALRGVVAIHT